jgi:glycerol-3-phosphate dehydrogenase
MKNPATLRPADPASVLNSHRREIDRDLLTAGLAVDVLVVGGGVTGTGVALDAASRGLSVALIERGDLASGTSAFSSKLVHGGLRYLAKGDLGVAWESASERSKVAGRIAPHLIHPIGQLVPIYREDRTNGYLANAAFRAGDILRVAAGTPRHLLGRSRRINAERTLRLAPTLRSEGLLGAVLGWDCQLEDDARLVVALARTAAAYGAKIVTQTEALSLDATGASVRDCRDGTKYEIRANHVVNATGVWAGGLDPTVELAPSIGTHVVVRSSALQNTDYSINAAVPDSWGRFVFTLPQPDGVTYIGLTDHELNTEPPRSIAPPPEDIPWILNVISGVLETPIDSADVVGSFAGMRALVRCSPHSGSPRESDTTADISRRHLVKQDGNLVTITGGKLTTYRRMASDAVDLITETRCRTSDIALVGAGRKPDVPEVPDRLWRRYGNEAPEVWSLADADPALREPIAEGIPVLGVELAFGVEFELAMSPADLLDRRTRIGLVPGDVSAATPAAEAAIAVAVT